MSDELTAVTEPVPEVSELYQESPDTIPRIPVSVEQATVYRLPALRAVYSYDALTTTKIGIAAANRKRNRAVVVADAAIFLSRDSLSQGAWWPANVPYVAEHCDAIFACTVTGTGNISCIVELWAD